MFLISFSKNDHVICYSRDSWHAEENCIKFSLEHILCNDGTHWKSCPLDPSNVQCHCSQFPGLGVQFHHPITLAKVSYHKLSHSMEFSKYFLDATGVAWFPFQSLIQVPLIRQIWSFFFVEWSSVLESAGTFFSTITKLFTHSVISLTGSKIPSHSKFLISLWKVSWRWTGTHLSASLAGFAFGLSWNLYGGPGNFPILVNTSEYTLRMSCFFNGMP